MKFAILWSIFKKDSLSVAPIIALSAVLFLGDALIERLDLLSVWTMYRTPVLLAALAMLLMSIFQLDSPASHTGDWLCRPIRKRPTPINGWASRHMPRSSQRSMQPSRIPLLKSGSSLMISIFPR